MINQLLVETKACVEELNRFYNLMKDLGTKFNKPTRDDALSFAYTEAGELLDAYMRINMTYVRNNERTVNDDEMWMEYTQCMIMLMASLPENYCDKAILHFMPYEKAYNSQIFNSSYLTLNDIKTICVDVNNIFNHANSFIIENITPFNIAYAPAVHNYNVILLINNMMFTLITHNKQHFINKVFDKWLQNHYVKHIKPVFINTFTNDIWTHNITIDNVYTKYQEGVIKQLC